VKDPASILMIVYMSSLGVSSVSSVVIWIGWASLKSNEAPCRFVSGFAFAALTNTVGE
jgi:hypothetical protein